MSAGWVFVYACVHVSVHVPVCLSVHLYICMPDWLAVKRGLTKERRASVTWINILWNKGPASMKTERGESQMGTSLNLPSFCKMVHEQKTSGSHHCSHEMLRCLLFLHTIIDSTHWVWTKITFSLILSIRYVITLMRNITNVLGRAKKQTLY